MSLCKAKLKRGMKGSSCGRGRWEKTEILKKESKKRRRRMLKNEVKNF
jgi:hypothetical protein